MEFTDLIDLAAERLGGAALLANDEFFAPKENLLKASAPEWREGVYTERGKWMDGWETRRRRTPGYDWCVVRLGIPGLVRGIVVDTSFFRGNYPESCSIDSSAVTGTPDPTHLIDNSLEAAWVEIVPRSPLKGDAKNLFPVQHDARVTHLRLNIFPDGGVARLRVHGEGCLDRKVFDPGSEIDLAAAEHGGFVLVCSDMFFGHRNNLIMPGRSTHMGDGWETKRRRGEGHDWTIVRLAARGTLHRLEIDTDHFKGNAPGACSMSWCHEPRASAEALSSSAVTWYELLPRLDLQPHSRHRFEPELRAADSATHVRLDIYPDGGVARMRVFGRPEGAT